MTSTDAQGVATNFKNLIAAYSETLANSSLTVDFVDYSDSVIELINNGCPDSVVAVCFFFLSSSAFLFLVNRKKNVPKSSTQLINLMNIYTI